MVSPNFLEFPDGVRLAQLEEIPGPESERSAAWARVKQAHIVPGFTVSDFLPDERFGYYAEINVDASRLWTLFHDLCAGLLFDPATLLASDGDAEPSHLLAGKVTKILSVLEIHQYQLAHDGFIQFGLLNDRPEGISEILVTPTKHFKVWLNDIARFQSIMDRHKIPEREKMEFIDEYPRVTSRLPEHVLSPEILWDAVAALVGGGRQMQ